MKYMKSLLAALAILGINGCSDEPKARSALVTAGYTDIQITGYRWTGCDSKDNFSTGFKAKGPTGVPAEGVVCSGWFKGATIRLE